MGRRSASVGVLLQDVDAYAKWITETTDYGVSVRLCWSKTDASVQRVPRLVASVAMCGRDGELGEEIHSVGVTLDQRGYKTLEAEILNILYQLDARLMHSA